MWIILKTTRFTHMLVFIVLTSHLLRVELIENPSNLTDVNIFGIPEYKKHPVRPKHLQYKNFYLKLWNFGLDFDILQSILVSFLTVVLNLINWLAVSSNRFLSTRTVG